MFLRKEMLQNCKKEAKVKMNDSEHKIPFFVYIFIKNLREYHWF